MPSSRDILWPDSALCSLRLLKQDNYSALSFSLRLSYAYTLLLLLLLVWSKEVTWLLLGNFSTFV